MLIVLLGLVSFHCDASAPKKKRAIATQSVSDGGSSDLKAKIAELDESVRQLEGEVEILKAQNKMVIQHTTLGFLNQTYLKGGVSLVLPRARTIDFRTDTGLGAFLGIGQYLGRNHVVDATFEWDLYPSFSLRYRYEIHLSSPVVTIAPVIGYKVKAASLGPFDNFIDQPQSIRSSFFFFGGLLGFPMTRSLATVELLYLINQQQFIFANVGIHFFL